MKRLKPLIIPIAILLAVALCCIFLIDTDKTTVGPMEKDIYTPAANQLSQSKALSMDVTIECSATIGTDVFTQKHTKQITCWNEGSNGTSRLVTGTVQYGEYSAQITECYRANQVYLTLNDSKFFGPATEDFLSQLPPVQLLTPEYYETVTQTTLEDKIELSFTGPSQAESWPVPQEAELISAAGHATISPQGELLDAFYQVSYTYQSIRYHYKITAQYNAEPQTQPPIPVDNQYIPLEDVYAPIRLEQVCGYLGQSKKLKATLTENIFSEVDPIYYDRSIVLERSGQDATVKTQVELTDNSRGGQTSTYSQTETFRDGVYSIITGEEQSNDESRINSQDMNLYCKDLLTGNILSPAYITGVTTETKDGLITYRYSAGEPLAETVCMKSCETIYQNPAFLDSVSDSYDDSQVSYYLTVDPVTGLPVSSGLNFSSGHTIAGIRYILTARYEQTYLFD